MTDDEQLNMERRAEATALLELFAARIDVGESVGDLFVSEAVFVTPRGDVCGSHAIDTLFSTLAQRKRETGRISRHFISGIRLSPRDDGTLEVQSALLAFSTERDHASAGSMLIGDQLDILAGSPSLGLKFLRRQMTPLMEFSLRPLKEDQK